MHVIVVSIPVPEDVTRTVSEGLDLLSLGLF